MVRGQNRRAGTGTDMHKRDLTSNAVTSVAAGAALMQQQALMQLKLILRQGQTMHPLHMCVRLWVCVL